ncbi:MAG: hypothetical protein KBC96_00635 [Armatimonadetes bacterium]|nr:hypothetical protein [Armatimonadota bacterium]
MRRLRSSILNVALIGLLLAVCISAQAGVVSLTVTSEGIGPGSSSNVVFRGCAVKFTYIASDCDEHDSDCCWDDLTFPVWPEECPLPTKVNDTIYMGECTITCDWTGPKDFVFKADDQVHCTNQENDDLATQTITITGVEVDSIVVQNAPWIGLPNAPVCPCPEGTVGLTAVTNPVGYEHLISWSGGGVPETGTGAFFQTYWTTPGTKTVRAGCGDDAQTMDIEVAEPFYDASFLDLTGPVGGTTAVKYQVTTRCVAHGMPGLETRHTANDPWTDDDVIALGERCTTNLPDENGITSYMYPLLLWQTIERVTDGNGVEHNLDKVGDYLLRGTTDMTPCTSQQTVTDIQPAQVGVKNLTVESADPEGVVFWTGEEETTIPI